MAASRHQRRHPLFVAPPVEGYLELERNFLVKFHERNRTVFNALVVCHYKFLVDDVARRSAIGEATSENILTVHLQNSLLGALSTSYLVGEEIGHISKAYWEHIRDYSEPIRGLPQLLGDPYAERVGIHRDFCAYMMRESFQAAFNHRVADDSEFNECCRIVKEANATEGTMHQIKLEDTRQ